ncbi:MAG: hypothetical protein G01um101429_150 [Parcubacteria group bacterium Gr01-1014_29]|nr:MAG: hypothetical protein G01um101429_150 [Parcubacteria group bacterium Gr01-1014_29]
MDDTTNKQPNEIFDRLEKLPPELKDVMFSTVTAEKMFDIGKRHGLLVDKLGDMAHETGLLMLGVTHPDEFIGNLASRLEVNTQKANAIADDINREIFAPVREQLRAVFGGTAGQGETPTNKIPPGLPFPKGGEKSIPLEKLTPPLEKGVMGDLQGTSTKPETTLEDLEAELEHALAGQGGGQPLSVVKKPANLGYKGADPYREQVEEHMPNVRGAPYVPSKEQVVSSTYQGKEEPKPIKEISIATPTPKSVEEPSVFSPLSPKPAESATKEHDTQKASGFKFQNSTSSKNDEDVLKEITGDTKNGSLQAFRGFNMNNNRSVENPPRYGFSKLPPYRENPTAKPTPAEPVGMPQPITKNQNDSYREKIE